ncbi:TetR/AcrR family transcriptional regulator [Sphaerisporangium sp. TRM90804]|uniref:TetR/AcrR family transcriptional regulator n=1 Tax=Sphaerisporangium sp. TRM90804 TaxID=3031113 RepID=UPI00244D5A53|nr:TetR/AcrR family transcriptional regulator [Sphaerisporangium sp. TRM90804]MDH2425295.1 TetR/AcrR family transcriptional regulator [Sphaerisporangium sp. TRM90804]
MAAETTAITLLWGHRPAPKRGPKPTLTLDTIAAAGIELADADGLAAVTMQRVAERLGVTKMALYRYVPGKVELVALMTDLAMGEPPPPAEATGWRPRLDTWARRLLDRFRAHPWALEATVGPRAIGPNEFGWMEQATAALTGTGLTGSQILDVAATLTGHVRMIAQQTAATPTGAPEQAMSEAIGALLFSHQARFPTLSAAMSDPSGRDQALDFGLRCILDGVEPLLAPTPALTEGI